MNWYRQFSIFVEKHRNQPNKFLQLIENENIDQDLINKVEELQRNISVIYRINDEIVNDEIVHNNIVNEDVVHNNIVNEDVVNEDVVNENVVDVTYFIDRIGC